MRSTLSPTHFLISTFQLLTRLVGVTTMAFLTIGFPSDNPMMSGIPLLENCIQPNHGEMSYFPEEAILYILYRLLVKDL